MTPLAHHLSALDRAAPLRLTGRLTQLSGLALEAAMAGAQAVDETLIETVVADLGLKSEAAGADTKTKTPVF